MSNVLTGYAESGLVTAKFVRRRQSDGAWWNVGAAAFEAYSAANIALYGIPATETGATGVYTAADPADTVAGDFLLVKAVGANLAVLDLTTGIRWQDSAGSASTADWSDAERQQIRRALGVTGTAAPTSGAGVLDAVRLKTDTIGAGTVFVVSPVSTDGKTITVKAKASYRAVDGRAIDIRRSQVTADWPDLTGAVVTWVLHGVAYPGSVLTPTGPDQAVRWELGAADTAGMESGEVTAFAVLTNGDPVDLCTAQVDVE